MEKTLSAARQLQTLCVRLRTLMRRAKLTAAALAKEAGVSRQSLDGVLNGRSWPDFITVHRLEAAVQDELWINPELPPDLRGDPRQFRRRDEHYYITGFVDLDDWQMQVSPANKDAGWRWDATRLTDEGWTLDESGIAEYPDAAERAAEQHIAERIAAEARQSDEQEHPPD